MIYLPCIYPWSVCSLTFAESFRPLRRNKLWREWRRWKDSACEVSLPEIAGGLGLEENFWTGTSNESLV